MNKELLEILQTNDTEKLDKLIISGIDIKKEKDEMGNTALLVAAKYGQIEMFEYLLKNNHSQVNEKNDFGDTALILAAVHGQIAIVKCLFTKWKVNFEDQNEFGHHALSTAAFHGHSELVAYLFEKGAYIDLLVHGRSVRAMVREHANKTAFPLLFAAELLLDHASDRPSIKVKKENLTATLEDLINTLGKGLNARQFKTGNTALHVAILGNKTDIVKFLLENGADISIPNREGETPLALLEANPYLHAFYFYYALCQIEKAVFNLRKQDNGSLVQETKIVKEIKERKELKETKELKGKMDIISNNLEMKALEKKSEKLLDDYGALLDKLAIKEAEELCMQMSKLLTNIDSPLFNPARAYKILNGVISRENAENDLSEVRKLLLEILIGKKIIFIFPQNSIEPISVNVDSDTLESEETKESFDCRLKLIIKYILQSESIHNDSLGNYITQYVHGDQNSLSGIEGIKEKSLQLYLAVIENLKDQAEKLRKKEKAFKEMEVENEKLRQENERQRQENERQNQKIEKQQQEINHLRKMLSEKQNSDSVSLVSAENSNTPVLVSFQSQSSAKGESAINPAQRNSKLTS